MGLGVLICKGLNRLFPLPAHPFNLAAAGRQSYAEWQFERGGQTLAFYLDFASEEEILRGKQVLDLGCGAGGKTLYYASRGADQVTGIDVVPKYREKAETLAQRLGLAGNTAFLTADATGIPFPDASFDTIIANDVMEHVPLPAETLAECHRVLKPGGRLYANFPPLYHPYGAHLSDAIGIPWVHAFFREETLIRVYKDLMADLPDGPERIAFRFGRDASGRERITYINGMTLRRFEFLLTQSPFQVAYRRYIPLRPQLRFLARLWPETFVKMAVFVLEKTR